jgi:hypothetical protein
MLDWMREVPLARGLLGEKDFGVIYLADTPEEVFEIISKHHQESRSRGVSDEGSVS